MPYTAKRYQTENGEIPYTDWMKKLRRKDQAAALKVDSRIARAMSGNFGDHKFERTVSGNYGLITVPVTGFIIQSKMAK